MTKTEKAPIEGPQETAHIETDVAESKVTEVSDDPEREEIRQALRKADRELAGEPEPEPEGEAEPEPEPEVKDEEKPKPGDTPPAFAPKEIREEWSKMSEAAREAYKTAYSKQQAYIAEKDREISTLKKEADVSSIFEDHPHYSKLDAKRQKEVLKALVKTDRQIWEDPVNAIMSIAQANKVDLRELFTGDPQLAYDRAQHEAQARIAQLQAQVQQYELTLKRQQQAYQQQQEQRVQQSVYQAIENLDPVSKNLLTTHPDGGEFSRSVAFYAERIEAQRPSMAADEVLREAVKKAKIEHGITDLTTGTPASNGKSPTPTPQGASPELVARAKNARSLKSSYPGASAAPQFSDEREEIRWLLKNG